MQLEQRGEAYGTRALLGSCQLCDPSQSSPATSKIYWPSLVSQAWHAGLLQTKPVWWQVVQLHHALPPLLLLLLLMLLILF